ncbi:geranylgeranyl pyrophosphate synthetase [Trapelia coarctata]|nr:geranylgeranyl pyrophosphate synthetase [Trapelia coarctata]
MDGTSVSNGGRRHGEIVNGDVSNGESLPTGEGSHGEGSNGEVSNGKVSNGHSLPNREVSHREVSNGEVSSGDSLPNGEVGCGAMSNGDCRPNGEISHGEVGNGEMTDEDSPSRRKPAPWEEKQEKTVLGPYDYLYGHPGKDIRSELIAAFNAFLDVPSESLQIITKTVGMLHTASLLVDDVQDSSHLRRGVPVAHNIFGTAQTINSANYVYFCALQELQKLRNPKAIEIYIEELLNLHRGQGMDLYWRDTLTCPSEEEYLQMVGNKTGGLFRLAVKLLQTESSRDKDCIALVDTISLIFQILDDYKNLSSAAYNQSKGVLAEDLTEGKFSFPVIHAIRSDPSNMVLINILKQKTDDENVKRYAVAYMERMGSFAYTRKVLCKLAATALSLVDELEISHAQGGEKGANGLGDGIKKFLSKMKLDKLPEHMWKLSM